MKEPILVESPMDEVIRGPGKYIVKYEVPRRDYFVLDLPIRARILKIVSENGSPFLFVLIESASELERRYFHIVATLEEIEPQCEYIDSCQVLGESGNITIHLFEGKRTLQ